MQITEIAITTQNLKITKLENQLPETAFVFIEDLPEDLQQDIAKLRERIQELYND